MQLRYPSFAKWIRSHRDLPLQLNQWTNVVRWEFKQPTPFLRTREFLWQEGHTAHATEVEATNLVRSALDLYSCVYTDLLALPVIKGVKSVEEKFAGSVYTETLEAFIPETGRGIQAATSHYLGQNFARMFGIRFEDDAGQKQLVHQTCWGFTTRCIGIMIMVHGDDKGLVLPPRVAPTQAVLIPIPGSEGAGIEARCSELATTLKECGVRAEVDARRSYTPGWKFNWWEMKGVPLRLEVGPKDMAQGTCRMVCRFDGSKKDVEQSKLATCIPAELKRIHEAMLEKATRERDEGVATVARWDEVVPMLNQRKLIMAPWCESAESEVEIRSRTKEELETGLPAAANVAKPLLTGAMKSLCIPLIQPPMPPGTKCFVTGDPAKRWALFGRSY